MIIQKNELPVVSTRLNLDFSYFSDSPIKIASDAIKLLSESIYDMTVEALYTIYLDSSAVPLCVSINGKGTNVGVLIPVSDILRTALLVGADGIVVLHNHPDTTLDTKALVPSQEDIAFTTGLLRASALMNIKLWDSIIVGGTRPFEGGKTGFREKLPTYYSMRTGKYTRALKAFSKKINIFTPKKEEEIPWDSPDDAFNTIGVDAQDGKEPGDDSFAVFTEVGDLKKEKVYAALNSMIPGGYGSGKRIDGGYEKYDQVPGMTPPAYEVL